MGEDCNPLALCDPMRRMNCDVDSLPENSLSTPKDSEYDSEVEYKHRRRFWRLHSLQESFGGDASDTDVSPKITALLGLIFSRNTFITPLDLYLSWALF